MRVGVPKGLLYYKYYPFIETFLKELGQELVISEDTNKDILDMGVKCCVDEACLPIKIFHGHVESIKEKCDIIIVPRIMSIRENESICPKFCALPEMVKYSIDNMPLITELPLYIGNKKSLYEWIKKLGFMLEKDLYSIKVAYLKALAVQNKREFGINDKDFHMKVALLGHPYNIYDKYINMDIVEKLNRQGVGVVTEEFVDEKYIDEEVDKLFKRPFWSLARSIYGCATYFANNKKVDGIVYVSSFSCGIDSVIIELIKEKINDFPLLVIKIDEQTGEGGVNTRIEAFTDMLERRNSIEGNFSTYGERLYSS